MRSKFPFGFPNMCHDFAIPWYPFIVSGRFIDSLFAPLPSVIVSHVCLFRHISPPLMCLSFRLMGLRLFSNRNPICCF